MKIIPINNPIPIHFNDNGTAIKTHDIEDDCFSYQTIIVQPDCLGRKESVIQKYKTYSDAYNGHEMWVNSFISIDINNRKKKGLVDAK